MLTKFTALAMGVLLSVSVSAADMATLTRQAQQGDAVAQYYLGEMYYEGKGVREDESTAKHYFGQACDHGLQLACDYYCELNEQGH